MLTTTTLLPLGLYPADTYNLGPVALPVGVSAATLSVDRTTWNDPALRVTASLEFSPDGGVNWFTWGSFGTVGGVVINPKTGLPATVSSQSRSFIHRVAGDGYGLRNPFTSLVPYVQAPGTIEPGFEPTNPNRMVRGTVTITAAITTAVLMTLDDAAVPLTLPAAPAHQSVSIADLTFNSTTGAAAITLTTPSFTITSNPNRAGLLGLCFNPNTPTGISGNIGGSSFPATLIANTDSGSSVSNLRSMQFQVIAPPAGSQTGTMSWTTAVSAVLGAAATSGVDQTTPFNNGTFAFASSSTGPSSVTITSTSGDLTCDTSTDDGTNVPSSPSQTQLWAFGPNNNAMASRGPGAGNATHTWVLSVDTFGWVASGCNFKQAAAAGATVRGALPTSRYAGPQVQRFHFRQPSQPLLGGRSAATDLIPGAVAQPVVIASKNVGPAVKRFLFRPRPALTSVAAAAAGAFSGSGDSTATIVSQSTAAAALSAAPDSTATFVGAALTAGALSAAGDSTATFVGKALAPSVLAAAGDSTATFVAKSTAAAALTAPGDSSAAFVGASLAASVFSAASDSTAAFVAAGAGSVLDAAADSTATLVGKSLATAAFSSAADSTGIFVSSALGRAVLAAQGDSTASWIGIAAGQPAAFDPGARKPRRRKPEPPYKLHPEEILRQQKMTQDYLDELDRKAAAQVTSTRQAGIPSGSGAGPARVAPRPRLTAAMAHAATMAQLRAIVAAKLASERDRARAKEEQQRRRRAIAVTVMLMSY